MYEFSYPPHTAPSKTQLKMEQITYDLKNSSSLNKKEQKRSYKPKEQEQQEQMVMNNAESCQKTAD